MRANLSLCLVLILGAFLSGCCQFRSHGLETTFPEPPEGVGPVDTTFSLGVSFETADGEHPVGWLPAGLEERVSDVLMLSGYFLCRPLAGATQVPQIFTLTPVTFLPGALPPAKTDPRPAVRPAASTAELHLDLDFVIIPRDAALPSWVSTVSLLLIPNWADTACSLRATVFTGDGRRLVYELEESETTVSWLPGILLYPFFPARSRNVVRVDFQEDLTRALIGRMVRDGLLRDG